MELLESKQKVDILNTLNNHVKSQIIFYALENGAIQKVHFSRLYPFVQRMLGMAMFQEIIYLFDKEENMTIAKQVLNMLSSLGEVAKLPNGYYLPLPERVVELPVSKRQVLLSSTQGREKNTNYIGVGSGYGSDEVDLPKLMLEEWMPSVGIKEFCQILNQSQVCNLYDKPDQIFIGRKKREWMSYENGITQCNGAAIVKCHIAQGPASYYWLKKIRNRISYYKIPNEYVGIAKFALEKQAGISRTAECFEIDATFFKVKFFHRIPENERNMLMLFGFPENVYDPFCWIIPTVHHDDFVYVINRLGMKVDSLSITSR
ncbi:hypothetical protein [Bacillus mobilis]|uniref:hypothetical protein n=1 Tax=Bacillus mobilis TaxID=2026190 RepID=UPI003CF6422F